MTIHLIFKGKAIYKMPTLPILRLTRKLEQINSDYHSDETNFQAIFHGLKIIFVSSTSTIGEHFTRAGYCVVEISRMYSVTRSNRPGKGAYLGYCGTSTGSST